MVLTFDAPARLLRCLSAIQSQTRGPDATLIVDNAGRFAAEESIPEYLKEDLSDLRILRLSENLGPAGGYAAGLRVFLESDFRFAWVMDDDCDPSFDCLERLLERSSKAAEPALVLPVELDEGGVVTNYPAWSALLLPREIVQRVGLPMAELFWWAEDTEYLQWRIPRAGFAVLRANEAVVVHRRSHVRKKPPWKFYYETRNSVFYRIHVQHGVRLGHLFRYLLRVCVRVAFKEDERIKKACMVTRGVSDGVRARLGRRILPRGLDRATDVPAG